MAHRQAFSPVANDLPYLGGRTTRLLLPRRTACPNSTSAEKNPLDSRRPAFYYICMVTQVRKYKKPSPRSGRRGPACRPPLESLLDPRLFRALSDPTRLHLLVCLAGCCGPQTVGQAAECCSVDFSVVSRHLALLRDAGVLSVEKKGREVLYQVRCGEVARILRTLADALDACCPGEDFPNATRRRRRRGARRPA